MTEHNNQLSIDGKVVVTSAKAKKAFDLNLEMLLAFQNDGSPMPAGQGDVRFLQRPSGQLEVGSQPEVAVLVGQKYFGWGSEPVKILHGIKNGRMPASDALALAREFRLGPEREILEGTGKAQADSPECGYIHGPSLLAGPDILQGPSCSTRRIGTSGSLAVRVATSMSE